MVLVIDCQIAGISGDMLLSSLVDLGADSSRIIDGVKMSQEFLDGSYIDRMDFIKTKKHGTSATSLLLEITENVGERKGSVLEQCIIKSCDKLDLSQEAKQFALNSINSLIQAEARFHGQSTDSVHFHEASSIDTIVDILGTAIALDDLHLFGEEIVCTPVAVGGGHLSFSHGTTSNPAGAILEIFKDTGIQIRGGGVKDELATPTGSAMLATLTNSCQEFYPPMTVDAIGYGAGTKDFETFSNVLKLVLGKTRTDLAPDTVTILETNVDDVSGETLGHLIDKVMSCGAKDITVTPTITKKGRPAYMISVICSPDSHQDILDVLISETRTLGVRIRSSQRVIVSRESKKISISLQGKTFEIHYKMSGNSTFKIESDDVRRVSSQINQPFLQTEELIRLQINKVLERK